MNYPMYLLSLLSQKIHLFFALISVWLDRHLEFIHYLMLNVEENPCGRCQGIEQSLHLFGQTSALTGKLFMPRLHTSLNGAEVRLMAALAACSLLYTNGGTGKVGQGEASVPYGLSGVYLSDWQPWSFLCHQLVLDDHTTS